MPLHEFYDLDVKDDLFSVTLSFNNVSERITVPFSAITRFADPYAEFAVTFEPEPPAPAPVPEKTPEPEADAENVVSLSAFRKKK